jgi:hypothetical protein
VAISSTNFTGNELLLPWLAAGGAFYCFKCEQVTVDKAVFSNNSASYGGGAAILYTMQPSSMESTIFFRSNALSPDKAASSEYDGQ